MSRFIKKHKSEQVTIFFVYFYFKKSFNIKNITFKSMSQVWNKEGGSNFCEKKIFTHQNHANVNVYYLPHILEPSECIKKAMYLFIYLFKLTNVMM